LHKAGKEDEISLLKDSFPRKCPMIKLIPTTEAEIKSIIYSLKSKKSSSYDEITTKILKACSSQISFLLNYICNYSMYAGIFPDLLKISAVKPLYKKKVTKFCVANYRPITVPTTFSEVLEKVMYSRSSLYMHTNNILVPEQFSFRTGLSTENVAFKLNTTYQKLLTKKKKGTRVALSVKWLSTDWTTGVRSLTEAEGFSSSLCV
jgi:hypothetical protein